MEIVDRDISLGDIARTIGPRPSAGLVRSVRRHGVLVPVLLKEHVRDDGTVEYRIIDGNRRVAAARRARRSALPARIMHGISADEAARVTLAGNSFRTSNYVTEFWAISQLERSGVSHQAISYDSGLSENVIATRRLLRSLDRRVFVGLAEGRVVPGTALTVARLDRDSQDRLGDRFAAKGRLLKRDITAIQWGHRGDLPPEPVYEEPSGEPEPFGANAQVSSVAIIPEPECSGSLSDDVADVVSTEDLTYDEIPVEPDPCRPGSSADDVVLAPEREDPPAVADAAWGNDIVEAPRVEPPMWSETASVPFDAPVDDTPLPSHASRDERDLPPNVTPMRRSSSTEPRRDVPRRDAQVSSDLRLALRTIARQAESQGLDEQDWVRLAREEWRYEILGDVPF